MTTKNFSINDLISLWRVSKQPQVSSIKVQIESNPVLIETFTSTRTVPIVTNVRRLQHSYVGANVESWWGWTVEELLGGSIQSFLGFVHPNDLVIHQKANVLLAEAFDNGSYEEKMQLRLSFNYRIRSKKGQYVHILQTSSVLEIDTEGNLQTALTLLQEVNHAEDFNKYYVHLYGVSKYRQILEYRKNEQTFGIIEKLSEREVEITKYLLAGLDSKQISDCLFISRHTVDTHRRKILQKLRLQSSQELSQIATLTHLFY
jgi:DNA-binding CsgD family transcriptional regulator